MATFNQQGQKITGNQYNADEMNFGAVQTSEDLVAILEQINKQFAQARDAGILSEETATDTQYQITKATQQAKKPDPDKKTIVDHLTTAKTLIEGVTATSGLVTALAAAIQIVLKLFL